MSKVKAQTVDPKKLSEKQINRLYSIMCKYYDNMDPEIFREDLLKKDATFLLIDVKGEIQGFTSVALFEKNIDGQKIAGVFSGDTIVEKGFRGSFDLPFAWLKYVYSQKDNYDKMFWFMLSKGYRTYRLLPRFFKKHYPCYKEEAPEEVKNILNIFAKDKYGEAYNPETNIFIPEYNYFLKSGKEEIKPELLNNPHIKFFKDRNPGFYKGHELISYADFDMKNLSLYGLFFVKLGSGFLMRFFVFISKSISRIIK